MKDFDELLRDITAVGFMAKSEARERMKLILHAHLIECLGEDRTISKYRDEDVDLEGYYEDIGYNNRADQAIERSRTLLNLKEE